MLCYSHRDENCQNKINKEHTLGKTSTDIIYDYPRKIIV